MVQISVFCSCIEASFAGHAAASCCRFDWRARTDARGMPGFRRKGRGIVTHNYCFHSVPSHPGTPRIRCYSPRTRPRPQAQQSPHFRRGRLPGAEGPPAGSKQGTAGAGLPGGPFGADRCESQLAEANRRRRRVTRACCRPGSSLGSL